MVQIWGDLPICIITHEGRISQVSVNAHWLSRWWLYSVMSLFGDEPLILARGWWRSEVINVLGDECVLDGECLRWWMSDNLRFHHPTVDTWDSTGLSPTHTAGQRLVQLFWDLLHFITLILQMPNFWEDQVQSGKCPPTAILVEIKDLKFFAFHPSLYLCQSRAPYLRKRK